MRASRTCFFGWLMVLLAAGACTGAAELPARPALATPSAQATSDDVVLDREQVGTTVTVSVGQVIRILRPAEARWQVDYAFDILRMLTPEERVADPGPDGWRLQAAAAGETDVMLTMIVQAGGSPNVMRLTYTVRVVQ